MNILISGGNGLIGKSLVKKLKESNYNVRVLSRKKPLTPNEFYWNPEEKIIDEKAFDNLDAIIHLAGASISKKWTPHYKKELHKSRIGTANLLKEYCANQNIYLKAFISASGINYYGTFNSNRTLEENSGIVKEDFLANLCKDWENAADGFSDHAERIVCLRTAMVLAKDGGAFPKLKKTVDINLGAAVGSGKQRMNWIHIDDLVDMYVFALNKSHMTGKYNAVADDVPTNRYFMFVLTRTACKFFLSINIPEFLIKLAFGEMSSILLEGTKVSNKKIKSMGFDFQYSKLQQAFRSLM